MILNEDSINSLRILFSEEGLGVDQCYMVSHELLSIKVDF